MKFLYILFILFVVVGVVIGKLAISGIALGMLFLTRYADRQFKQQEHKYQQSRVRTIASTEQTLREQDQESARSRF